MNDYVIPRDPRRELRSFEAEIPLSIGETFGINPEGCVNSNAVIIAGACYPPGTLFVSQYSFTPHNRDVPFATARIFEIGEPPTGIYDVTRFPNIEPLWHRV